MLILDSTVRQPKQQRLPYHVLILFSSYRLQHLISFQPLQPSEAGMKWDSVCMRMLYYLSFIASLKIMCISAWLTCFNHCHIYSRIEPHTGLILYTFHIPHHKWKGQGQKANVVYKLCCSVHLYRALLCLHIKYTKEEGFCKQM